MSINGSGLPMPEKSFCLPVLYQRRLNESEVIGVLKSNTLEKNFLKKKTNAQTIRVQFTIKELFCYLPFIVNHLISLGYFIPMWSWLEVKIIENKTKLLSLTITECIPSLSKKKPNSYNTSEWKLLFYFFSVQNHHCAAVILEKHSCHT